MTEKPDKTKGGAAAKTPAAARRDKLAQALRANLRKRKDIGETTEKGANPVDKPAKGRN